MKWLHQRRRLVRILELPAQQRRLLARRRGALRRLAAAAAAITSTVTITALRGEPEGAKAGTDLARHPLRRLALAAQRRLTRLVRLWAGT